MRYRNLRYYPDPETGEPHIYEHDVTEDEVEEVMWAPGDDFKGRKNTRLALGQTAAGRYLQVVFVPDADQRGALIVTAYDLSPKTRAAYERRRRRK